MAIVLRFTDWYILDPLLSLAISFFILSKAIPRFWSTLKIFLDAVPEGVDIKQVKNDLEQLDNVASINQLNLWTMDGLEKMLLSMFVWSMSNISRSVKSLSETCSKRVAFKMSPSKLMKTWQPTKLTSEISKS